MKILSFFFNKNGKHSAITNQVRLRAEEFVINFGEKYKGLDYSPQSILVINRLLSDYSQQWQFLPLEKQSEILTNASCYILWVAHQQYQGKFYWSEEHLQPVLVIGEPDYRLCVMLNDMVKKCIDEGETCNISTVYRKISDELHHIENDKHILIS